MTIRHRRHYVLPDAPTGYEINPYVGLFSVITPIARTNLITNPSFETNTTSWTAIGGSIARSTTHQYHGAYSLAITPTATTNDGVRYDTVSLTSGTTYAYSAKVRGQAGVKYKLAIETTGGVELTSVVFTATGRWQWVYGFWTETSTTTRRLTLRKSGSTSTAVVYLDGAQVEACAAGEVFPTTYIDGDQAGLIPNQQPPAYVWNGTPHASTSARSGQTRAGGRVVNFDRFKFRILSYVGFGLMAPTLIATPHGLLDGSQFQRTAYEERRVQVNGSFYGRSFAELQRARASLYDALARDASGLDQPLVLHYQAHDGERPLGEALSMVASFAGGLDGQTDNLVQEKASPAFTMFLPVFSGHDAGTTLTVQQSVNDADFIFQRTPAGAWQALDGGMDNAVRALAYSTANLLYAGGDFTNAGSTAANRIASWSGTAWAALGTGANGRVLAIAIGPNGHVYAGGEATLFGGVANTNRIARWDGSAWNALSTGANDDVLALTMGPDGRLYAAGAFTTIGGVACNRIAVWNGSAFAALGTGMDATVRGLAFGRDGKLYAVGDFTTAGGTSALRVAVWDGSAWAALSTGLNGTSSYAVAAGADGRMYVGGDFTTAGGVSALRAAVWNGAAWSPLGSGLNGDVRVLTFGPDGKLYAGGDFTTAGGLTLADRFALWTGSAWVPTDVDLTGTPSFRAIAFARDGTLSIGFLGTAGAAVTAATTTVTNTGSARSYPTIRITGPSSGTSRIYQLINETTEKAIYFNYTINAGETAVLTLEPDRISFVSDFQGNVLSTILPGSNLAEFFLQPGANSISFFAAGSTVTATMQWQNAYNSVDDITD